MREQKFWIDHLQLESEKSPKEIKLRKIAKRLGLAVALVGIPLTFFACAGSIQSDWNPFLVYASVSCILRFFSLLCALGFPLFGGALFIVDGGLLIFFSLKYSYVGVVPALWSLLLIMSGILFLLTWYEHRKSIQDR